MDNKETVTVNISFNAEVDPEYIEDLKRIVDHHLDYLLDLKSFREIKSISSAKLKEVKMECRCRCW